IDTSSTDRGTPMARPVPAGTPVATSMPPLGTPTSASTPPLVVAPGSRPGSTPAPIKAVVLDWLEEDEAVQQGDTYASISQRKFKTDKYAAALERFNRDHPRLGSELRRQGLVPGVKLAVPSAAILEERYPDAIPGLNKTSKAPVPGPASSPLPPLPGTSA